MIQDISPRIKYIGVTDNDIDLFESQYPVPRGITYNSYLIEGGRLAIIDTVAGDKGSEWKSNLHKTLAGRTPDYLIVEHMEPDHSSIIKSLLDEYPSITIVATAKAIQMLPQFFDGINLSGRTLAVKDGDTLDLEGITLKFLTAPMVHWPEVMTVFAEEEKVYFTSDAFGTFGQFEDSSRMEEWKAEARRYYFNICGKYGPQVQALLKKSESLDFDKICPLHGPVLSRNGEYFDIYRKWSSYEPEEPLGVLIAYASIYGGTAQAAVELSKKLTARGIENVEFIDLCRCDMSEALAQAFRMGTLVAAAASYDAGLFPPMLTFLHHLQSKAFKKRIAAVIENGSWAPSAGKIMTAMLSEMKDIEIAEPMVTIKSRLNSESEAALETLAYNISTAIVKTQSEP